MIKDKKAEFYIKYKSLSNYDFCKAWVFGEQEYCGKCGFINGLQSIELYTDNYLKDKNKCIKASFCGDLNSTNENNLNFIIKEYMIKIMKEGIENNNKIRIIKHVPSGFEKKLNVNEFRDFLEKIENSDMVIWQLMNCYNDLINGINPVEEAKQLELTMENNIFDE